MKLRLKFKSSFVSINTEGLTDSVYNLIEKASKEFNINVENLELSLNANDYFGLTIGEKHLKDLNIVNGDIIYIRSLNKLDNIKYTMESEILDKIDCTSTKFAICNKFCGLHPFLYPIDVCAISKGLCLETRLNDLRALTSNPNIEIIRLTYTYPLFSSGNIVFTIFTSGLYVCFAGGISSLPVSNLVAVERKSYFVNSDPSYYASQSYAKSIYKNVSELINRLMDELIEPLLLSIHEDLNLEPRLHLFRLPYNILISILCYLSLRDVSKVFLSCWFLHNHICSSESIWLRQCRCLENGIEPIGETNVYQKNRLGREADGSSLSNSASSSSIERDMRKTICPSFQRFRIRYKELKCQRKYTFFSAFH